MRRSTAKILEIPTGQITRAMGDVHPLGNPHYWLDPENGKRIAQDDRRQALPAPAERSRVLRAAARGLRRAARRGREALAGATMAPYKGTKIVTYHRSFPNFAERFGLDVIGYVEPQPGIPPTPQHTLDLIERDEAAERQARSSSSRISI